MATKLDPERVASLGPAERSVQILTTHTDHYVHNRPGVVMPDTSLKAGVRWQQAFWKQEGAEKVVYLRFSKEERKRNKALQPKQRCGVMDDQKVIRDGRRVVGRFMDPGLFEENVAWVYQQLADIYKTDQEFLARFASWSWAQDHKDLKCVLAAFLFVQPRAGTPVMFNGKVDFFDDDYRAVAEAMCFLRGTHDLNPRKLLLVGDILKLPMVAEINRKLGFAKSAREPALGRWPLAVEKWLASKDANPKLLKGLVKAGFKETVKTLCRIVGYKGSEVFYQELRWKQKQADDGRRQVAVGKNVKPAESWEGLGEKDICKRIIDKRMSYKTVMGRLPRDIGLTRAIMAAVVETGTLSDQDYVIVSPTLEELGLLDVPEIKARYQKALESDKQTNLRMLNVGKRLKSAENRKLNEAAGDKVIAKSVEKVSKDLRFYFVIDKSISMKQSMPLAKRVLTKFLGGFPVDRTHISVFNSEGSEIILKSASAAGVEQAFSKHDAGGTTCYSEGFRVLSKHKPKDNEDALVVFIGDEGEGGPGTARLVNEVRVSGINPVAFALLKLPGDQGSIVRDAAQDLGIPCLMIDERVFDDPYAAVRVFPNLIATTPVVKGRQAAPARARSTLVEEILKTELLQRPAWAC